MAKKKKLTPRTELFCQKYVLYHNAARSAREAGFSEKTAVAAGSRLLTNVNVQARIVELQNVTATQFNVMKQYLIGVLMDTVGAKIEDITDPETGVILPAHEWPDHMKRVITGMESDELYAGTLPIGMKRKVKLNDKNKAIELLNKMCGFNMPEKQQVDLTSAGEQLTGFNYIKPKD